MIAYAILMKFPAIPTPCKKNLNRTFLIATLFLPNRIGTLNRFQKLWIEAANILWGLKKPLQSAKALPRTESTLAIAVQQMATDYYFNPEGVKIKPTL